MTSKVSNRMGKLHLRASAVLLVALTAVIGCGNNSGLSHIEQVKLNRQLAADALKAKGATAAEHRYPQGDAWIVDLSGHDVDKETLRHLQSLGQIAELDLSRSTVGDPQIQELAALQSSGTLIKLNLSETQVSDAGLLALAKLHLLFEINVKGSKVTAGGIESYRKQRPKHPFGVAIKVTK
jgi:hypothetical protein